MLPTASKLVQGSSQPTQPYKETLGATLRGRGSTISSAKGCPQRQLPALPALISMRRIFDICNSMVLCGLDGSGWAAVHNSGSHNSGRHILASPPFRSGIIDCPLPPNATCSTQTEPHTGTSEGPPPFK